MQKHVANTASFKTGQGHQPEHRGRLQPGKVKETAFPKRFQKERGSAKILVLAQGDQFQTWTFRLPELYGNRCELFKAPGVCTVFLWQ